jgi:predicted Zn-dependent protease
VAAKRDALQEATLAQQPGSTRLNELNDKIEQLEELAVAVPDDFSLHNRLARLFLLRYRMMALVELRASAAAEIPIEALWERTSDTGVHAWACDTYARDPAAARAAIAKDPKLSIHLLPSWKHLVAARASCPLHAENHLRIARLSVLTGGLGADRVHLARAERCQPATPSTLEEIARLEAQAGRAAEACRAWRRALELDPARLAAVLAEASRWLDADTIIADLLPAHLPLLVELAAAPPAQLRGGDARQRGRSADSAARDHPTPMDPEEETRRAQLRLAARAEMLLDTAGLTEAEELYYRARLLAVRRESAQAALHFARAVELEPFEARWRLEFGRLLASLDLLDRAVEQLREAVRLAPDHVEYQRALAEVREKMRR